MGNGLSIRRHCTIIYCRLAMVVSSRIGAWSADNSILLVRIKMLIISLLRLITGWYRKVYIG
jgi:hypothetical protein